MRLAPDSVVSVVNRRACSQSVLLPSLNTAAIAGHSEGGIKRAGEKLGFDAFQRFFRLDAECAREPGDRRFHAAGAPAPAYDRVAPIDRLAHHVAKRLIGARGHGDAQRAAEQAVGSRSAFEQGCQRQLFQ